MAEGNKMKEISAEEFVRYLKSAAYNADIKFTLFLGAGCSISSGIPAAGPLVKNWLPKLKKLKTGIDQELETWVKKQYPGFKEEEVALYYGRVIEDLFFSDEERQQEIERLCGGKDPGFGYAVLAQLMSERGCGEHFNIALTTNFDDLIADALYLFTNKKPLVISHESLINFASITRTRPLVIKLHGDARLAPLNTDVQKEKLDEEVSKVFMNLLLETGLIFIGYGGNDRSIVKILSELPTKHISRGIYWVNEEIPKNDFGEWLKDRKAIHVKHQDFDEIMLLLRNEFGFNHPDRKRFIQIFDNYKKTFEYLEQKVLRKPDSPEKIILKEAMEKALKEITGWWLFDLNAKIHIKNNDLGKADLVYQEGIKKFPREPELICNYAVFLAKKRRDYNRAEEYFKKAVEADPNNAITLSNYGLFLETIRKNYAKAEEYYKKAIEADPNSATSLIYYGLFLGNVRKNYNQAEEYYGKAIQADPNDAASLSYYGFFLETIRKNNDKAEEYYKKAVSADPNNAEALRMYALFLQVTLKYPCKAKEYYQKMIETDPNGANSQGYYAYYLESISKDYKMAEEYYQMALKTDPNDESNLVNYAAFLFLVGDKVKADELLEKASSLALYPVTKLECFFYKFAHSSDESATKEYLSKIKTLIADGVRSYNWDFADNVKRAVEDGHPYPEFLAVLARVISDELNPKSLEEFDIWKSA